MNYPPGWEFYDLRKDHNASDDPHYQQLKGRLRTIKTQTDDGVETDKAIQNIVNQHW